MIAELLGRFHPLIVHLPVGILILAFLMELASRTKKYAPIKVALPFVLQVAVVTALFALLTGWIMPKAGAFDESLIRLHFWSSVSMTISSIILCYLAYQKNDFSKKIYFPIFMLTMMLLTVTGHFGGSLTHGEGHLTNSLQKESKTIIIDVNALEIYADLITPILKKKCYSCHNEGKKKGELVMTNISDFRKGGVEGPIIIKGEVSQSSLIQRAHLPVEDEAHMPPKGKVQLTKNEIKLIEWWINSGADFSAKVGEVDQPEEVAKILKGYEEKASKIDPRGLKLINPNTVANLANHNITVIPASADSPFAYASFRRDTSLNKRKLKMLKKIGANITELDLSFTNLNDAMMSQLVNFKNLQKLKLQNTQVSSDGLKYLEKLKHLTLLNLYGTKVDDEGLTSLKKIASLSSLFLWQTNVTQEALATYQSERPSVQVSHKIDASIFGDAKLKPPTILTEKDIFQDSLKIELQVNFKNVNIFYTIDGTLPDTSSMKYDSSFYITNTTAIKAIAAKKSWISSAPAEKVIIKAGHTIATAKLSKPPNQKYPAEGANSLIDFKKGSTSFSDGMWLGYEAEDMIATLDLGAVKQIKNVVVGALEDTNSYIFFPKRVAVKTSKDGKNFNAIQKLEIPLTKARYPSTTKSFLLNFETVAARYVQIQIKGTLKNPEWHANPGAKNWIFIDEILVN